MKGTHVLMHSRECVDQAQWQAAQPKRLRSGGARNDRGPKGEFDDRGRIPGAIEGEEMDVVSASAGQASIQQMRNFSADQWSGGAQLFWRNATPRARMELEFEIEQSGEYDVAAVLTTARDYAKVNLQLDGVALGSTLDLYDYPDVQTTGLISFGKRVLEKGTHRLRLETVGNNPSAVPAHMVGLDCLVLTKE
jgi:hypothetical protein